MICMKAHKANPVLAFVNTTFDQKLPMAWKMSSATFRNSLRALFCFLHVPDNTTLRVLIRLPFSRISQCVNVFQWGGTGRGA